MTNEILATWSIQHSSLSETTNWTSFARLSKNASNQIKGRDQQWKKLLPNWGKWLLFHRTKRFQDFLHCGGLNLRFYQWRQLKVISDQSLLCYVSFKFLSLYQSFLKSSFSNMCSYLTNSKNTGYSYIFLPRCLHTELIHSIWIIFISFCFQW